MFKMTTERDVCQQEACVT